MKKALAPFLAGSLALLAGLALATPPTPVPGTQRIIAAGSTPTFTTVTASTLTAAALHADWGTFGILPYRSTFTITGGLSFPASYTPTNPTDAVTKAYADGLTPGSAGGWTRVLGNVFLTAGSDYVTIQSSLTVAGDGLRINGTDFYVKGGSVGIGTTAPLANLDVNGTGRFGTGATISTFSSAGVLTLPTGYTPSSNKDAATKDYVDAESTARQTLASSVLVSTAGLEASKVDRAGDTMTGDLIITGKVEPYNVSILNGGKLLFNGPAFISTSTQKANIYVTADASVFAAWVDLGAIPDGAWMSAVEYCGGKIFVTGSFEGNVYNRIYDIGAASWSSGTNYPAPLQNAASVCYNGKLYVFGGDGLSSVRVYDPALNTWTSKTSMSQVRAQASACLIGDKIYVIGGTPGEGFADALNYEYDPDLDTWTAKTSMSTARMAPACGVVNDKIYVTGGQDGAPQTTNEEYDPATDTWTTKAVMLDATQDHVSAGLANKLYVIGGSTGIVQIYDPAMNTWAYGELTPAEIKQTNGTGVVGNAIYTAGGTTGNLYKLNTDYLPGGSGGKVGIGTTAPQTLLDVEGTASFGTGADKSTFSATGGLTFDPGYTPSNNQDAATKYYVDTTVPASAGGWTKGGTNVYLTSGADYVTVQSSLTVTGDSLVSGNMGVKIAPSYPLDVNGAAYFRTSLDVLGNAAIGGPVFSVGVSTLTVSDGMVGINTASPTQPFDVNGIARFRNIINAEGDLRIGSTIAAAGYMTFADRSAAPTASKGRLYFDSTGSGALYLSLDGASFVPIATGTAGGGLSSVAADASQFSGNGQSGNPLTLIPSSVTLHGSAVNVADSLVLLDGSGNLPVLNGSNLTNVTGTDSTKLPTAGGTMTGQLTNTSTVTVKGQDASGFSLYTDSGVYMANGCIRFGDGTSQCGAVSATSFVNASTATLLTQDYTNTSGMGVAMAGSTLTMTTANVEVEFIFMGQCNGTNGATVKINVLQDGSYLTGYSSTLTMVSAGANNSWGVPCTIPPYRTRTKLSAGSHSWSLSMAGSSASETVGCSWAGPCNWEVREVR